MRQSGLQRPPFKVFLGKRKRGCQVWQAGAAFHCAGEARGGTLAELPLPRIARGLFLFAYICCGRAFGQISAAAALPALGRRYACLAAAHALKTAKEAQ
jgi:hypothetical protein